MPKITLENGKEIIISQESYDAMCKAVQNPTYEQLMGEIMGNFGYRIADKGLIDVSYYSRGYSFGRHHAKTKEQLEALLCLNMWLNVAEYLNEGWKPDWDNGTQYKYHIYYIEGSLYIGVFTTAVMTLGPWFKSRELALKSVEILGEETCKKALGIY